MTKKQWLSMCEKDKIEYVFNLGVRHAELAGADYLMCDFAHSEYRCIIKIIKKIERANHKGV